MSDKVAAALGPDVEAVRNNLARRRELNAMLKPDLISYTVGLENDLHALTQRIEAHGEPL